MQEVAGKYTLLRKLATGGMAEVFLAVQRGPEGFEKLVVVKKVLPNLAEDAEFIELFLQEARTAADLRHPHVVDVYEVAVDDGVYFMAMEFLQGPSLAQMMKECRHSQEAMPMGAALQIVIDAANGLHHAHTKTDLRGRTMSVVHRDVSPQNIIVTCQGITKVIDFGIARVAGRQSSQSKPGVVRGKAAYMSPEQASGRGLDPRTDQFSLGVLLYEITTNRRLFDGTGGSDVLKKVITCELEKPSAHVPGYPPRLEEIVMKSLAKDRDDRFESCEALAIAIDSFLEDKGIAHSANRLGQYVRSLFQDVGDAAPLLQTLSSESGRRFTKPLNPPAVIEAPTKAVPAPVDEIVEPTLVSEPGPMPPPKPDAEFDAFLSAIGSYLLAEPRKRSSNVPPRLDTFVGRSIEIHTLETLFEAGQRLVTLHGPPGIGKTRLAIEVAKRTEADSARSNGRWSGAFYVDLAEARSVEGICYAAAQALDVTLLQGVTPEDAVAQIGAQLQQHARPLIVFDRFDILFEHAPATLSQWIAAAPKASFLVTAREPLDLPGESSHAVGPLTLPGEGNAIDASEAVQLFVHRVRAVRPGYAPGPGDWPSIAHVVKQLDGVPLVIELAAARMMFPGITPAALQGWLPRRFDLVSGARNPKGSSAMVADAVAWSWKLLPEWEQSVLAHCSVSRGGFSVAEGVALIDRFAEPGSPPAMEILQSLRGKALLRFYLPVRSSDLRFDMYEPVRTFATHMLEELGKKELAHSRHAQWCRERGNQWQAASEGPGATEAIDHLALELDNLIAAFQRCRGRSDPDSATIAADLALAIHPVLELRGPFGPHLSILDTAIEAAEAAALEPRIRARLRFARGMARRLRGLVGESIADLERAHSYAERSRDIQLMGRSVSGLGASAFRRGDLAAARALFTQGLQLAIRVGDRWYEGRNLFFLGNLEFASLKLTEADRFLDKALEATRMSGDRLFEARTLGHQALVLWEQGDIERAEDLLEEVVARMRELGNVRLVGYYLGKLACARLEQQRLQDARLLLEKAILLVRESGDTRLEAILIATRAGLLAGIGDLQNAREGFDLAGSLVAKLGDPLSTMAVDMHRVILDLAFSFESSSPTSRNALRESARKRMDAAEARAPGGSPADRSDEVRFALRRGRRAESALSSV